MTTTITIIVGSSEISLGILYCADAFLERSIVLSEAEDKHSSKGLKIVHNAHCCMCAAKGLALILVGGLTLFLGAH